jgi:hypothetical protein
MSLHTYQKNASDVHENKHFSNHDEDMQSDIDEEVSGSSSEGTSHDTDDEIAGTKTTKSKKTLKRKRRATEPSRFGATLQFLLDTDAPSAQPLSLKPWVARKRNDEKLELKAKKILQIEKKEKEDKGRVTDVIGGWGGESERALRKVAQRGGGCRFPVATQIDVYCSCQAVQRHSTVTGIRIGSCGRREGFERFWETFTSDTIIRQRCKGQREREN